MSLHGWLLCGFAATLTLDLILAAAQGLGLTRISLPYILGTIFTASRDRARLIGFFVHLFSGWAMAAIYVAAFEYWHRAGPLLGALLGLFHAAVVLLVVLPLLPGLHPRMASVQHGPEAERMLEPPGALGLHYGISTPVAVVVAHLVYGAVLGGFYRGAG